jgi:hypothetical protein
MRKRIAGDTSINETELGYMAKIEPEFIKRNAKPIGLSIDPVGSHGKWVSDIEETQTGRDRGYLSQRLKSAMPRRQRHDYHTGARHGALDLSAQQQSL